MNKGSIDNIDERIHAIVEGKMARHIRECHKDDLLTQGQLEQVKNEAYKATAHHIEKSHSTVIERDVEGV